MVNERLSTGYKSSSYPRFSRILGAFWTPIDWIQSLNQLRKPRRVISFYFVDLQLRFYTHVKPLILKENSNSTDLMGKSKLATSWQTGGGSAAVQVPWKNLGRVLTRGGHCWKDCFSEWWLGTDTMPMVGDLTRISTAWTCAMSLTRLPLKSLFLRWWIFSAGLFFFSDLNLSDILERCEAFWVPRSTVRVQRRRLCQDFQ